MDNQKACSLCGETKTVDEFRRYKTYCRKCQYAKQKDGVKKWKAYNRGQDLALMAHWRKAHPLSRKLSIIRRWGFKIKGMLEILEDMYKKNPFCAYCKLPLIDYDDVSLDHRMPISRGGHPDSPDNWSLCCIDCNYLKHDRTAEEYILFLQIFAKRVLVNTEPSHPRMEGVEVSGVPHQEPECEANA